MKNNWLSYGRAHADAETLERVASLIYQTDRYIYPFWRKNVNDFVELITPHMETPGFIFNYHNIYTVRKAGNSQPLGILVGLSTDTDLSFDYSVFGDKASKFVTEHYLQKVMQQRRTLPESTILLTNLCVDPDFRTNGVGSYLLYEYIWRMKTRGINAFQLDCLQKNKTAAQMYQKMGFEIIDQNGLGFDGTETPQVKLYTMQYTC